MRPPQLNSNPHAYWILELPHSAPSDEDVLELRYLSILQINKKPSDKLPSQHRHRQDTLAHEISGDMAPDLKAGRRRAGIPWR